MGRRKTKEDFIKEAEGKYGKKFDYTPSKWINYNTRIEIICPLHGSQWVKPSTFLRRSKMGCLDCAKEDYYEQIRIKEEKAFLKFCKEKFGDKYNYDSVKYTTCYTEVKIWCNKHKKFFWQAPVNHKRSTYCPDDVSVMTGLSQRQTFADTFIERAIAIHGQKYGYSATVYTSTSHKVKIYCKKCKKFFYQKPLDHLANKGCIDCAGVKKKTTEEFIEKSKAKFGGKFKLQQKRDQIKRDYCKNNNIKLIEIPYWDFDKIEQILTKELKLKKEEPA